MKGNIRITVLVENTSRQPGLLPEHGLSYWIETNTHCVLFDTGQGPALASNARQLRIVLKRTDAIVLSHGHYDHTGGLNFAFHQAGKAQLFIHPQAVIRRYAQSQGQRREIGLCSMTEQEIGQEKDRLVWTDHPTEIVSGVFTTGPIPRCTNYEGTGGNFFLDSACTMPDPILDDQAVYMDTDVGIVVLLGCAHAGIVNTLNYIQTLTQRPIHAVIGGTYLINASYTRIDQTIADLRGMNLNLLVPTHCTGPQAMEALWSNFPAKMAECQVGAQWIFPHFSERKT